MARANGLALRALVGGIAGLAATHVMDGVGGLIYTYGTSEADRKRERALEPKFPLDVLGERIATQLGRSNPADAKFGTVLHWGVGFACGALHAVLAQVAPQERRLFAQPVAAGMLAIDEFGFQAVGLAPASRRFPIATNVRATLAHAAYGVALALFYEGAESLLLTRE